MIFADDPIRVGLIQHDCILIKWRKLDTETGRYAVRTPCEDKGKDSVDAIYNPKKCRLSEC